MKIKAVLGYNAVLEATIPTTGLGAALNLLKTEEILAKARTHIAPMFHKTLTSAISQLKFIGIDIKVVESHVEFAESNDKEG